MGNIKTLKFSAAKLFGCLLPLLSKQGANRGIQSVDFQKMRFFLIVLDRLGDAIMTTPIARIVKSCYPKANITVLTRPTMAPVFENNPFIDKIILDEAPWWSERPLINSLNPAYWLGLASRIKQLRRKDYDIAIDFRGDLRHILLFGLFIKPKYLIGYSRTGGEQLLSISLPYQEHRNEIDKKTDLLKPLGISNLDKPLPEIFLTREEIQRAESILEARISGRKGPFILIDPGAKPIQRWPLQRFANVAKTLSAKWEIRVIISVAPIYKKLGKELIKIAGSSSDNLIHGLDLRTLSAVVHLSDLVISCDTGIVHLAKAVGTPTVTLYGPTDPQRFGYQDRRSRIIRSPRSCSETSLHERCKVNRTSLRGACISAIDEKSVISAANELLALNANTRFKPCPVQSL